MSAELQSRKRRQLGTNEIQKRNCVIFICIFVLNIHNIDDSGHRYQQDAARTIKIYIDAFIIKMANVLSFSSVQVGANG